MSNFDPTLLLAYIEYASWALNRTFECVDKLPAEAITQAPGNSCRSILAVLKHLFQTDWYYFVHLKGERRGPTCMRVLSGFPIVKPQMSITR